MPVGTVDVAAAAAAPPLVVSEDASAAGVVVEASEMRPEDLDRGSTVT